MIRFGLCCKLLTVPIKFRVTTVAYLKRCPDKTAFLESLLLDNCRALAEAITFCAETGIRSFRVTSQFFPACTHSEVGYNVGDLPFANQLIQSLKECKKLSKRYDIRLTFHPDQFVVLSSPDSSVLKKSLKEIEYHAFLADLIGADVINIHGGGAYGDKKSALARFEAAFRLLSRSARAKLTVENDEKSYSPIDLLPLCRRLRIPFVYDVHHHRCLPDGMGEEEATLESLKTWKREPLFHLSSPLEGWKGPLPNRHHDYIDPADFPSFWLEIDPLTVDIEAKAKELAIFRLIKDLGL
ncbi:MAG: UV DNA damage repair endonuclease UvsE [Chlamydiales bacterium]|nr:UV DNA damage repair endonuclease UvsE [Chlamydiales bacterium]